MESYHHNHSQLVTRKQRKSTAIALAEALLNEDTKLVKEISKKLKDFEGNGKESSRWKIKKQEDFQ